MITPGVDIGGFGRLGAAKVAKRAEGREERRLSLAEQSAGQTAKLRTMQIQRLESDLQVTERNAQLKSGLTKVMQNIPEGENQFTTAYNYFMQQGATKEANALMDRQYKNIDNIYKLDKRKGVENWNNTIGKSIGSSMEYVEDSDKKVVGDVLKMNTPNGVQYVQRFTDGSIKPIKGYVPMEAAGAGAKKEYSPSPLKKLIDERQDLIDSGTPKDDPMISAYDSKITGVEIDVENITQDEVDALGAWFNYSGKMPSFGRGKSSTALRKKVVISAVRQAKGETPSEKALNMIGSAADTKAIQGSLNTLEKQASSMGSFITNIDSQITKIGELSKDLYSFDSSLMNIPLRLLRGRVAGSSLQAKYDMYLTEIEGEIGKLASGATGSVAELSQGAQEKWAKIHDKNLSVGKMMELLTETGHAANFRYESVRKELVKTRERMRTRDYSKTPKAPPEALEELRMHPESIDEFEAYFHYRPEGF